MSNNISKVVMILCVIVTIVPVLVSAGTITKTLSFSEQDLNIQQIGEWTLVSIKGSPTFQIPGEPIIPIIPYNVLVPADAEVTEIKVLSQKEKIIAGEYYLYPSQEPRTISSTEIISFTEPNPRIYSSSEVYPEKLVDFSSTGTKSGYRIASFGVHPVRYIPSERKLTLITNLTLEIKYEEGKVSVQPITERQSDIFSQDVKSIVMNSEDINRFAPPLNLPEDNEIDCVIITNDALMTSFQPLIDWHNKKGFRTEIKTTASISSTYLGRDLQEKIRNFIKNYFNTRGLKWVILGGDNAIVPARHARAFVSPYTGNIPSDLYYADLQWSWDGNNNNVFGESGYDTVDFFADVYVGRASVDNASEITTFTSKVFTYEKNPDITYIKKALLPSAELWSGYNHVQSQDSIAALSPSGWTDRVINQGTNELLRYQVRDSLNAGFGIAHLVGHGDDVGVYIVYQPQYYHTDAANQTNYNKLSIVNSIACTPGNFEYSDCLAEAMMNAQGCAVAVIMNSRYGWGQPPSIGPSELLDIRFYNFFFSRDSLFIGSCHSSSKDFYRYLAETQQIWRWCVFELNLFGNPLMPMWSDVPQIVQVSKPDTIQTGPRNVQITVTKSGLPVNNALVGIYKPGEVYAQGKTNVSGQVNIAINALTPGTIYFTASGKNCYPKQDSGVVVTGSALPYLVIRGINPTQVNLNQTANVNILIRNSGTASATNTMGKIRTNSSYITISDSLSNYGTVNPGDSAFGDSYSFFVSPSTPPGTQIPFTLFLSADQGSWNYNFNIQAGQALAPGMIIADHDTGYCLLTVTAQGSIGYTAPNEKIGDAEFGSAPGSAFSEFSAFSGKFLIGSGFRYPKAAISALYYSSMLAGNSANYIVDRFYGQPATNTHQDWNVSDSLNFVNPPIYGNEHLRCSYNDQGHTAPRGLKVTQNSYMSADSRYDDFVILVFNYENQGGATISGLYSGIIADFDIDPSAATSDIARSDATRRLVYMRKSTTQNPTVGIKLLSPTTVGNLTCIDHDRYVYPDSAMTESMKYRILNGGINLAQSNRTYDWSVALSATPFNLTPSQSYRVAYAFIGGNSEATLIANADTAQAWYDRVTGLLDENDNGVLGHSPFIDFTLTPNPTIQPLRISFNLLKPGLISIGLYDVSGQLTQQIFNGEVRNSTGVIDYQLKDLPSGVYFVKLATGEKTMMKKFLLVK